MSRTITNGFTCTLVLAMSMASARAGVIRFTPVASTDPAAVIDVSNPLDPSITIAPGESVLVEVEVLDWGPDTLRTVQVDLDTSGLVSGSSGSLSALNLDADPPDGACDSVPDAGGLCPICGGNTDFDGAYIDVCRNRCTDEMGDPCDVGDINTCGGDILACLFGYPDFMGNMPGFGAFVLTANEETLVALVTSAAGSALDDGGTHYVASFVLGSSSDAEGLFTVESFVEGDPDSDNGGSFTRNLNGVPTNGFDILGRFRVMILNAAAPEACCFPAGGCDDLLPDDCTAQNGLPQGADTTCADGCPAPPEIVHGDGQDGETSPCSGYIDPRAESTNGQDINLGLDSLRILFNEMVFAPGGGPVGPSDFIVTETGGGTAPGVASVDASANPLIEITLDDHITLQEWTTVRANVQNAAGILILNQGDLGPDTNEPDRVDIGYLTADVNNNGNVNPLDLLKFKQFVNGVVTPDCGTLLDFTDINRNGSLNPLDLLRFKQAINGITPPSTQVWAFKSINNPRP